MTLRPGAMRWLAVVLGVVAAVLAAPLTAGAGAFANCDVDDFANDEPELAFLDVINAYRAENGLGALALSANLNRAAAWMASDMGVNGYFGHVDSLGRDPWKRTVDCGYPVAGGENLAAGTSKSGAGDAFELFRGSPTHNANMLVGRYRQIGIARVYVPGSRYGWYWATTFGTIDDGTGPGGDTAGGDAMTASPAGTQRTEVSLAAGVHQLAWPFASEPVADVLRAHPELAAVYVFDSEAGMWSRSGDQLPPFARTLDRLESGRAYWFVVAAPVVLSGG